MLVNFITSLAPNLGAFCTPDLERGQDFGALKAAIDRAKAKMDKTREWIDPVLNACIIPP